MEEKNTTLLIFGSYDFERSVRVSKRLLDAVPNLRKDVIDYLDYLTDYNNTDAQEMIDEHIATEIIGG